MCCDGTLFDSAWLVADDEVEALRDLGLPLEPIDGKPTFRQPCARLSGTLCSIYENRPKVCRTFRCETLKALDEGTIERPEANRRVATAKAAVADLRSHLEPGETLPEARVRFAETARRAEPAPASAAFALRMGVLNLILDRFFRHPKMRNLRLGHEC